MNQFFRSLICMTILFLIGPDSGFAMTLRGTAVISDVPIDHLAAKACQTPPANPGPFQTTEELVSVYALVEGDPAGEVLEVQWLRPDGEEYHASSFASSSSDSTACFMSSMGIASQDAAQFPGGWTVRGVWRNTVLFTASFTIESEGSANQSGMQLTGVANAASNIPASSPGGGIAQGSFFSAYGIDIGPVQAVAAHAFPLQEVLGGVSMQIRQGEESYPLYPHYVSQFQVNGIMNSRAPLGDSLLVLDYMGQTATLPVRIVRSSFGIFTVTGNRGPGVIQNWLSPTNQPLNTTQTPAQPDSLIIIWGTGLGAVDGADNVAPPVGNLDVTVKVSIGGKVATNQYFGRAPGNAAVDEIIVTIPSDVLIGCDVPVQVEVEGTFSNVVTMAIQLPGQACHNPLQLFDKFARIGWTGSKFGAVGLLRASLQLDFGEGEQPLDMNVDLGVAGFSDVMVKGGVPSFMDAVRILHGISIVENPREGLLLSVLASPTPRWATALGKLLGTGTIGLADDAVLVPLATLLEMRPPAGACRAYDGRLDAIAADEIGTVQENLPEGLDPDDLERDLREGLSAAGLDAGDNIVLSGPGGDRDLLPVDPEFPGLYMGVLGGGFPLLEGMPIPPLYLTSGQYRASGAGGAQIGALDGAFTAPQPLAWTNRSQISTVDRKAGFTVNWTGGETNQIVLIWGASVDRIASVAGGFVCLVEASDKTFRITPADVAKMPATPAGLSFDDASAFLGITAVPDNLQELTIPGLETTFVVNATLDVRTVTVE